MVHIDTNWFYQVQTSRKYGLKYISTKNGNILTKGDWLYAQYIARILLEGTPKNAENNKLTMDMPMSYGVDCCGEAANTD